MFSTDRRSTDSLSFKPCLRLRESMYQREICLILHSKVNPLNTSAVVQCFAVKLMPYQILQKRGELLQPSHILGDNTGSCYDDLFNSHPLGCFPSLKRLLSCRPFIKPFKNGSIKRLKWKHLYNNVAEVVAHLINPIS